MINKLYTDELTTKIKEFSPRKKPEQKQFFEKRNHSLNIETNKTIDISIKNFNINKDSKIETSEVKIMDDLESTYLQIRKKSESFKT